MDSVNLLLQFWEDQMRNDPATAAAMAILDSGDDIHKGTGTYDDAAAAVEEYLYDFFDSQPEVQAREADPENFEGTNEFWEGKDHSSFVNGNPLCANKRDPLAQSFFSPDSTGIYITRADVYLATKDETLPLIVQLRTVKMGLPTEEVIPFGEVVIDPENVLLSDTGKSSSPRSTLYILLIN